MSEGNHLLILSSSDRTSSSVSSTDFTVEIPSPLYGIQFIYLRNASIPLTYYNVDSTNDKVYYTPIPQLDTLSVTLNHGNYTAQTLVTHVVAKLNAVSNVYSGSYNVDTMKITISSTANFRLLFSNTVSSAASILGYENVDTASATSHTATYTPKLHPLEHIYIEIQQLSNHVLTTNPLINRCSFMIPITENGGETQNYVPTHDVGLQGIMLNDATISSFKIQLRDHLGRVLDLHGSNWNMILQILPKYVW